MTVTATASAKLNLYLDITGTRTDGYHLLETVMQSITLSDILTVDVSEGSGISVSCDNPSVPCGEKNIAYKAAKAYLEAAEPEKCVKIHIQKRIPSGAGMGGGSSDAAAVLAVLDKAFGSPVDEKRLYEIAAKIGADVPFCLKGGTRLCTGIGEIMEEAPEVRDCCFLVVMPDYTCPTWEAYKKYDHNPIPPRNMLSEFVKSIESGVFPKKMYNAFEVLYADSRIDGIKSRLMSAGAEGALLTGSGAAVFGVFKDEAKAAEAAKLFPQYFTSVCKPTNSNIIFT